MLGISLAMLIGSALLMLRLSPGGSFPSPLSQEEEKKYLTQWQNGDISSRNVLVEHNLRLVAHIIKKYYTQTNDIEDLISIGTIGLIKGINTYKPDKDNFNSQLANPLSNQVFVCSLPEAAPIAWVRRPAK